jgi:hypothetical protein
VAGCRAVRPLLASEAQERNVIDARVRRLIGPWPYYSTPSKSSWDVFPDGSFVAIRAPEGGAGSFESLVAREIHVVLNFAEELKGRAGGG